MGSLKIVAVIKNTAGCLVAGLDSSKSGMSLNFMRDLNFSNTTTLAKRYVYYGIPGSLNV